MTMPQFQQSVLNGYRNYMAVYEQAYETNDVSKLHQYAIDPLLSQVVDELQANTNKKIIWRFHNVLDPILQGWSNDRSLAVVLDCVQNLGAYEYSLADGHRLTFKKPTRIYYQTHMRYMQGIWKAVSLKTGGPC
jgi:hypothetical protein